MFYKTVSVTIPNGQTDASEVIDVSDYDTYAFEPDSSFDGAAITIKGSVSPDVAAASCRTVKTDGTSASIACAKNEVAASDSHAVALRNLRTMLVTSDATQISGDTVISISLYGAG